MFITPVEQTFATPSNGEIISVLYEGASYKCSSNLKNAHDQTIQYKDQTISISSYFKTHRRTPIDLNDNEELLVHQKITKEGIVLQYLPRYLCLKVMPVDKGIKEQSARFAIIQNFLKKKIGNMREKDKIFHIKKFDFQCIDEDSTNFTSSNNQYQNFQPKLIVHLKWIDKINVIKNALNTEVMSTFSDDISFLQAIQKVQKGQPVFVVLNSKDNKSYELYKAMTHVCHVPTQFCQMDNLTKDWPLKHIINQLKAKIQPYKLLVFKNKATRTLQITIIAIDVYHEDGYSIIGFMIMNQQHNKSQYRFVAIEEDNNKEEIMVKQFQVLLQTLLDNNYVNGDLYIIRDAYSLHTFKEKELKALSSCLYEHYSNIYVYFSTKRHDFRNYIKDNKDQIQHMSKTAIFLSDDEFLFTTKNNAVNLRYTFLLLKGSQLTKVERVSIIGQLSRIHYQFKEFKQTTLQYIVDQNVYAQSYVHKYRRLETLKKEIKDFFSSAKKGIHIYNYSLA